MSKRGVHPVPHSQSQIAMAAKLRRDAIPKCSISLSNDLVSTATFQQTSTTAWANGKTAWPWLANGGALFYAGGLHGINNEN